jgi:hypothetical protein
MNAVDPGFGVICKCNFTYLHLIGQKHEGSDLFAFYSESNEGDSFQTNYIK